MKDFLFGLGLYGLHPCVSRIRPFHDVLDVCLRQCGSVMTGSMRVTISKSTAYVNNHPLAIT